METKDKPVTPADNDFYTPYHYPLFKHMADNHNLILLESELEEICRAVDAVRGTACRNGKKCASRAREMKKMRRKKK